MRATFDSMTSARLGYIRALAETAVQHPEAVDLRVITDNYVLPLVAAAEAVLALHQPGQVVILGPLCKRHEAHRHFSITSTEASDVRECPYCAATVYVSCSGCGAPVRLDQCPDRLDITRHLLGKEGTEDG